MSSSTRYKRVGIVGAALVLSMVALIVVYPVVATASPSANSGSPKGVVGTANLVPAGISPAPHSSSLPKSSIAPITIAPATDEHSSMSHAASAHAPISVVPGPSWFPTPPALTVGETITFTSTSGVYTNFTIAKPIGNASGTVTFTVTGSLREGYTLTLTSGSLSLGTTTVAITGGSAIMGTGQASLQGSGTVGGGAIIFHAVAHPNLVSSFNTFVIDLQTGGQEYLVLLQVTTSHS